VFLQQGREWLQQSQQVGGTAPRAQLESGAA
jgi:hypothetical protein